MDYVSYSHFKIYFPYSEYWKHKRQSSLEMRQKIKHRCIFIHETLHTKFANLTHSELLTEIGYKVQLYCIKMEIMSGLL